MIVNTNDIVKVKYHRCKYFVMGPDGIINDARTHEQALRLIKSQKDNWITKGGYWTAKKGYWITKAYVVTVSLKKPSTPYQLPRLFVVDKKTFKELQAFKRNPDTLIKLP